MSPRITVWRHSENLLRPISDTVQFFYLHLEPMKITYTVELHGLNTYGSFTTAVSNSFLVPRKKSIGCKFGIM